MQKTFSWIHKVYELPLEPHLQSDHHGIDGGHRLVSKVSRFWISTFSNVLHIRYLPNYSLAEALKWGKVFENAFQLTLFHSFTSGPWLWLCAEKLQRLDGIPRKKGSQHPSVLQQGHNWNLFKKGIVTILLYGDLHWRQTVLQKFSTHFTDVSRQCPVWQRHCIK